MKHQIWILLAGVALGGTPALAQNTTCPNVPFPNSTQRCANTKFVTDAIAGSTVPLPTNQIFVGNASNIATAVPMSGDVSIVASGATTVGRINGNLLGSTTPSSGNILIGDGTQWVTHAVSGACTISSTGVMSCPGLSGFTQGSVPFAGPTGSLTQDNANLFWDNANKRLGIGMNTPGAMLSIYNPSHANPFYPGTSNYGGLAGIGRIVNGTQGNYVTAPEVPTVGITRIEQITNFNTNGGQNAALWVQSIGNNISTDSLLQNSTNNSIRGDSVQFGTGDAVGVAGQATQSGGLSPSGFGYTAFGMFVNAVATTPSSSSNAIELQAVNDTGGDQPWGSFFYTSVGISAGLDIVAGGHNLHSAGALIRHIYSPFDVGYGIMDGVVTAGFRDDSTSVNVLQATGAHTNGVNFTGATFSGSPFASSGFSVDAAGDVISSGYVQAFSARLIDTGNNSVLVVKSNENLSAASQTLNLIVNNADRTINLGGNLTLGGAFTTSGASALTFTTTGTTSLTLPTSGTLTVPASQADQEAASSATLAVTPARQQFHPSSPKAWVKFAGASGTISASYNVSSVTRSGAGIYSVNFTTAFSSASYACVGSLVQTGGNNGFSEFGSNSTSGIGFFTFNTAGTLTDFDSSVVCFGDQ